MREPFEFVVTKRPERVDAWSNFRLPFEPREAKKQFRDELRAAVVGMALPPDLILMAEYSSDDPSMCDVENILLYNVGMSVFRQHMTSGMQIERSFLPPSRQHQARAWPHHHGYRGINARDGFQHWAVDGVVTERSGIEVPARPDKPAPWWIAVKSADVSMCATAGEYFGLDIAWHPAGGRRPSLHTALKPMLDGVIAAFHCHDGSALEEIGPRLAAAAATDVDNVERLLDGGEGAPLGRRRLLWPYRQGLQWNPADDRCVAARVVLGEPADQPSISIRLLDVSPVTAPR